MGRSINPMSRRSERERHRTSTAPLPHRLDESPVGYSSASCSPAWLASASPTEGDFERKGFCGTINSQRTANSGLTTCLTAGAHPKISQSCEVKRVKVDYS